MGIIKSVINSPLTYFILLKEQSVWSVIFFKTQAGFAAAESENCALTSTGDHGYNDRCACGAALDQHCKQNTKHQPYHRVLQQRVVLENASWKKINLNTYNKYHDARQCVPQYSIMNVLEVNMLICNIMVPSYFPSGLQRGDKKGRQSSTFKF